MAGICTTLLLLLVIPAAVFAYFSIGFPIMMWIRKILDYDDTTFDIGDALLWLFWPCMTALCLMLALPNYILKLIESSKRKDNN